MNLTRRPRRLRRTAQIRNLVHEVDVRCDDLIYPVFVTEGENVQSPIESMPGIYHYSLDRLAIHLKEVWEKGVRAVIFFGVPDHKDACGSGAYDPDGIVQRALRMTKKLYPEMICIADICLCEYTDHGHCGVIKDGEVLNDETLELLSKAAVSCAAAGADIVAPSDMMDGRIGHMRHTLDTAGYAHTLMETELDMEEGADIIMVKPALAYLDIVRTVSEAFDLPLCTYSVSGEYAMMKAAAMNGWIDEKRVVMESMIAMKRAGAKMIITYYAPQIAEWLREEEGQR